MAHRWIRSAVANVSPPGHVRAAGLLQVDIWRVGQREHGLLGHHETVCYPFLIPNCH
jgi:hypothetical protein